ncbi:MAG: poly-gamma-glutamate hydrolase family protein [Bacteriovoracaceae bacterium]
MAGPIPGEQDHYRNFSELSAANIEGKDYSILLRDTPSKNLVMSFHGGLIEPGTTELGVEVAGNDLDFYTFVGNKNSELDEASLTAADLHLTAAHFDEPRLIDKTSEEKFCVGLHGFGGEQADFCVGGANEPERKRLVETLSSKFPELRSCELCCSPYNGVASKNPVNRCLDKGVQIEMSPKVRLMILSDLAFRKSLAETYRTYIFTH